MKTKITIIVEIDDTTEMCFEQSKNASYDEIIELLNEAAIRAEESISDRKIEEQEDY